MGADHVEGAGLAGEHELAVQVAEHQRADAERVAGADQLGVGQGHEGVAALDVAQGVDEAVHHPRLPAAGDQVEDHLAVRGGLEDRALRHELAVGLDDHRAGDAKLSGEGPRRGKLRSRPKALLLHRLTQLAL